MTHWRLVSDFKLGVTSSVIATLDAKLRELEGNVRDALDPDEVLEDSDHVLGLGLVALQSYLSDTCATIKHVLKDERAAAPSMTTLLQSFGREVAGRGLRDMHAVWHLANFWKHRDEWDDDWSVEATSRTSSRRTLLGLEALEIRADTEYAMIAGVEAIAPNIDLQGLLDRATEWREACLAAHTAARTEDTRQDS